MASRPGEGDAVSGLPEEWGRIVIPHDASELEELAARVRFELDVAAVRAMRRQRRLPFIVLAVTVAIALVSLFTVPWLGRMGQVTPPQPSSVSRSVESSVLDDCGADRDCASSATSRSSSR